MDGPALSADDGRSTTEGSKLREQGQGKESPLRIKPDTTRDLGEGKADFWTHVITHALANRIAVIAGWRRRTVDM